MSRTACEDVFAVPEMAEMILLQLPMRDILVNVQRTSRAWQRLVNNSLAIQQAIFMRPVGHAPLRYFNPDPQVRTWSRERWAESEDAAGVSVIENPIITNALQQILSHGPESFVNVEAARHPQASWRRMFATQPPTAELAIALRTPQGYKRETLTNEEGLRLEELDLPWDDMRTLSITGWYQWQTCTLRAQCAVTRQRMLSSH